MSQQQRFTVPLGNPLVERIRNIAYAADASPLEWLTQAITAQVETAETAHGGPLPQRPGLLDRLPPGPTVPVGRDTIPVRASRLRPTAQTRSSNDDAPPCFSAPIALVAGTLPAKRPA